MNHLLPEEAQKILTEKRTAIYLDVRSEREFEQGHPEGAINIPIMHMGPMGMSPNAEFLSVVEKTISKEQTILCGCKSGGRSQRAVEMLRSIGFGDVANVLGGFHGGTDLNGEPVEGWQEAGLPICHQPGEGCSYAGLKKKAGL